ncbi:MAG: aminoglycoside phosphotransferase family protein [Chloroflexia bacterium]|nr:aminoglycoside phosphotransferase family protein [Chloroflexia bacterium]
MESNRATVGSIRTLLYAFEPASELLRVARPGQGFVNDVYFLTTSRSDLVLKAFDDEAGAWKPHKELAICSLMRELDIPSPSVLLVDSTKTIVPFIYSLSERIDGDVYSDVLSSLSVDENRRIYRQLGDYLGRLHLTTFSRFGDVRCQDGELVVGPAHELDRDAAGRLQGPFATWLDMHREIVNTRLKLMRGTAFADLVPRIGTYLQNHHAEIDCDIVPRLLHMDLHPGNILIRDGQMAAILDVEESVVGHNEYDLMRTELANFRDRDPAYERAFMDAYTGHVLLDEGFARRKHFYDASRTLAWIRSLILNSHAYPGDQADRYRQAARSHVESLA